MVSAARDEDDDGDQRDEQHQRAGTDRPARTTMRCRWPIIVAEEVRCRL
jgi:hypothetical protein